MSCLTADPPLYPEDLFDTWNESASERCWWAVYTKARNEKALARQLHAYEIPFYLPLVGSDRLIRGKRVRYHVPLFSGHLFVFASSEERVAALTTNRISRTLAVEDGRVLACDLLHLRRLIDSGAPVTVERQLSRGDRVRIKSGAVEGVEGTVIRRAGRTRLLVAVTFLQQGASMEIEDFQVEPLY
jgi:hypothetical protein